MGGIALVSVYIYSMVGNILDETKGEFPITPVLAGFTLVAFNFIFSLGHNLKVDPHRVIFSLLFFYCSIFSSVLLPSLCFVYGGLIYAYLLLYYVQILCITDGSNIYLSFMHFTFTLGRNSIIRGSYKIKNCS